VHDERLLTMTFLALVLAIVIIITLDEPERAGFWVRRFREGMRCASRAEEKVLNRLNEEFAAMPDDFTRVVVLNVMSKARREVHALIQEPED